VNALHPCSYYGFDLIRPYCVTCRTQVVILPFTTHCMTILIGKQLNIFSGASFSHTLSGKARPGRDVVVFFSHSGNTAECVTAALELVARGVATLTVTGNRG